MTPLLLTGDCVQLLADLPDASVDAICTDPPYGLEFMGKEWDKLGDTRQPNDPTFHRSGAGPFDRAKVRHGYDTPIHEMGAWHEAWAREALRVLKPGGHALVFGGTRTYHRLACGLEDAGFEIRDCLAWLYGSGFPKSLDVSKAIDAKAGAVREVVGTKVGLPGYSLNQCDDPGGVAMEGNVDGSLRNPEAECAVTAPATVEAQRWAGWGTALKPAFEPVVLARKPLAGTVAANVLAHGTGALNIDGSRIEGQPRATGTVNPHAESGVHGIYGNDGRTDRQQRYDANIPEGRWPANVLLDPEAAHLLDQQTGELAAGNHPAIRNGREAEKVYGSGWSSGTEGERRPTETGGASRFFYCAKVSRAERNAGLDGFATKPLLWSSGEQNPGSFQAEGTDRSARNAHPTVKPISLMRWLTRLITPPEGVVLDPFLGSGTTGCAAALEGFQFIGCERDPDYMQIAEARIRFWAEHGEDGLRIVAEREQAEQARQAIADAGQLSLLGDAA